MTVMQININDGDISAQPENKENKPKKEEPKKFAPKPEIKPPQEPPKPALAPKNDKDDKNKKKTYGNLFG